MNANEFWFVSVFNLRKSISESVILQGNHDIADDISHKNVYHY